jgi:polyphenol oxidase
MKSFFKSFQVVSGAPLPSLFLGQPYRAGDPEMPGSGTVEWSPHNSMHLWTGDQSRPHAENMGTYYSAGRDAIFYPHHANVDRLWETWRGIVAVGTGGRRHAEFTDPDWLDSSFLLYDEEARLVRITVRDVLDTERLRYTYGGVGLPPWLSARPPVTPGVNPKGAQLVSVSFPVSLDAAMTVEVRRAPGARPRSRQEKQAQEEVLVVEGIEADAGDFVRFDVYVNAREYRKVPLGGREMAGTFATLKHPGDEGMVVRTSMRVALNELLEDLGAEGDDNVTVTLVPVRGMVRIGGLRITYMEE